MPSPREFGRPRLAALALACGVLLAVAPAGVRGDEPAGAPAPVLGGVLSPDGPPARVGLNVNAALDAPASGPAADAAAPAAPDPASPSAPAGLPDSLVRGAGTIALFAAVSLLPVALLMLTAFVRISVVLALVRQALGSPQVPGTQVLTALSLLLTALVMAPVGQRVYTEAVAPLARGALTPEAAWRAGSAPIRAFMGRQIERTGHVQYLWTLYDHAVPPASDRVEPDSIEGFPFHVVAAAFLLSELTTALFMGFALFLPFLVVDLVVSAVLSAMGLFLLPPTLVALPLKLALFVLADGWMLVADMLLRSFGH